VLITYRTSFTNNTREGVRNYYMLEPCTVTEYVCKLETTGKWSAHVSNIDLCKLDSAITSTKWDCTTSQLATISATLDGSFNVATKSAEGFGGIAYIMWVGFAIIILLQAIQIGTYIFRK
jgi:hypothetical protein